VALVERFISPTGAGAHTGLSPGDAWSPAEGTAGVVAGQRGNWVASTYAQDASFVFANAGTQQSPIVHQAYGVSPGDTELPLASLVVAANAHVVSLEGAYTTLHGFAVSGNGAYGKDGVVGSSGSVASALRRCYIHDVGRNGAYLAGNGAMIDACEIAAWGLNSSSFSGVRLGGFGSIVDSTYIHDGAGRGMYTDTGLTAVLNTIIARCGTQGLLSAHATAYYRARLVNSVIYGCTEDGLALGGTASNTIWRVVGCILAGNGGWAIKSDGTGKGAIELLRTAFYTVGGTGEIDPNTAVALPDDRVTLTADPFVSAATHDYRLRPDLTQLLGQGYPRRVLVGGVEAAWPCGGDIGVAQQAVRPLGVTA
jgi:hypothetical protein